MCVYRMFLCISLPLSDMTLEKPINHWVTYSTHTQINMFTLLQHHTYTQAPHKRTSSPATYQTNSLLRSQAQLHQKSTHTRARASLSLLPAH